MRILIAEDDRITRAALARQLQKWGHAVTCAEDGQQAWELYQAAGLADGFDLVLTDWEMPRLSGLDLIARIREAPAQGYVYVIMLTSRSDKSDVVQGIEAGADDFVCKPFDRDELRVRLLAGVRIVNLERTLHRQNAQLQDANDRIHRGLQAAARVQRAMLPQKCITTPHVQTGFKYVPTEELAGDAIGLHLIDDRYLIAYVIDVSGHGVPAALLSVSAMHALDPSSGAASLLRDMTCQGGLGTVQCPAQVAAALNRRFRAADQDGRYLTMVLAVLDTHTGHLRFTSAGHPFPILLRGEALLPVPDTAAFPIALVEEAEYEDLSVDLQPGDRVVLVSDGLLEQVQLSTDQQFGEERLLPLLQRHSQFPPEALAQKLTDTLVDWAQAQAFADDVSVAVLDWLGT